MLRLGSKFLSSGRLVIGTARQLFWSPTSSALTEDANVNLGTTEVESEYSGFARNQSIDEDKLATPAELKAINGDGFFDNNVRLTGIAGKCRYRVDEDDYVCAAKFPIEYAAGGRTKVVTVTANKRGIINYILRNIEGRPKVEVLGTIGRSWSPANFVINLNYIKIIEPSEQGSGDQLDDQ